ncbi:MULTISPECIES: VOC family protein [Hydrogenophaga]|jgi:2,3-dihydroxybiphenyl 1,2-dioxygenase|uniref:VOC family protein n=1 Tax=Hydrogenophaga TaxID=47420 RepID=UPI0008255D3A|nr:MULTISPECIES: VOC family protein [Hydrogenophaga]
MNATATQPVLELGYLGFEVSDLARWRRFATEVLGMMAADAAADDQGRASLRLRMDQAPARLLLTQGPADDCAFAGWRLADEAALAAFCGKLDRLGLPWHTSSVSERALRGVRAMVHFSDPNGNRHEVYCGQEPDPEPFRSAPLPQGFVTGAGGLGHIVYEVDDYQAQLAFAREVLELRLSDTIEFEPAPRVNIEISFFHANERHHSFALAPRPPRPGPAKRVHHFMVEVPDITQVGQARDRCIAFGQPISMDIGQHTNDRMVSFYAQTPSGIHVEFGCQGVLIDDATWTPQVHQGTSIWGHRPRPQPAPTTP